MHIRDVSFDLFWDLRRCNTRISLCLPLLLHTHTYTRARALTHVCAYYTYASTTPAHHERRGTERGVRSLNFDPETTTARPFCAWPSTTGRRGTYIRHAIDGDEQAEETQIVLFDREATVVTLKRYALRF